MKDCQEITELIERSKVERVSLGDRLSIRFHSTICGNCRRYFKDSDLMDELLTSKRFRDLGEYKFSDSEKDKLKTLLRSRLNS